MFVLDHRTGFSRGKLRRHALDFGEIADRPAAF